MRRRRLLSLMTGAALAASVAVPAVLAAPATSARAATPATAAPTLPLTGCATYPGDDQICSGSVPSFDGSPMDFDVTLPATNTSGPHPLIVMLHGFGNNKHEWESTSDNGDGADKYHWNNHWFAEKGYYVLTYTARGFRDEGTTRGDEPATPPTSTNCGSACTPASTIRVKNKTVEIRDTQWLAALTAASFPVTSGGVDPQRVAVTGGSYGGGESWLQAAEPDWTFPHQQNAALPKLRLQVAVAKYPWTDLTYALTPNGHKGIGVPGNPLYTSSAGAPNTPGDGNPFGVGKTSYTAGLYEEGTQHGIFEQGTNLTPQTNGPEPITGWLGRVAAGEPYDTPADSDANPAGSLALRHQFSSYHSAYYQPGWKTQAASKRETAVFTASGWTDDLFEPVESFRMFHLLKGLDPQWPVTVSVGDIGHARAQNPPATWQRINARAFSFLQDNIGGPKRQNTTVVSEATVCDNPPVPPASAQITAATPEALSAGKLAVTYGGTKPTLAPDSGADDPNGPVADPIAGGEIPTPGAQTSGCRTAVSPHAGTTGWTGNSAALGQGRTYVGLGYVQAPYTAVGAPALSSAVLAARVWDVAPDGSARLMTKGVYRFDFRGYDATSGTIQLPLFGNEWQLASKHQLRLDLMQADAPYLRPPTPAATATLQFTGAPKLVLPTRQAGSTSLTGTGS